MHAENERVRRTLVQLSDDKIAEVGLDRVRWSK